MIYTNYPSSKLIYLNVGEVGKKERAKAYRAATVGLGEYV